VNSTVSVLSKNHHELGLSPTNGIIVHWNSHFYPVTGGIPAYIETVCRNVRSFEHVILTSGVRGTNRVEVFSDLARVVRVPPNDILRFPPRGWGGELVVPIASMADVVRATRQRKFIRALSPRLVNIHDIEWNLFQLGTFAGGDLASKSAARLYSPIKGLPNLLTKHFVFESEFSSSNLRAWERRLTLQFRTVVCVDRGVRETVQSWVDASKSEAEVLFIPNSIDTRLYLPAAMPTSDRLQVAFAGRLDRVRGEGLLLEFLEHLPGFVEFHGAIAADERRFADLARRFRSDRIHLYRNLPQSKMPGFLSKVQVLFNPLVVGYGVSRVTLEGMATGRCVLMTGQGDRYPLVTDETGLTCAPNLEAILSALKQLHRTPETIETIGRRARRRIEEEFSNEKVLPRLEEVHESVALNA